MVVVKRAQKKPVFPPEIAKYLDVAIYVLDARAPYSTFQVDTGLDAEPVFLLNKADLAERKETEKWLSLFLGNNLTGIIFSRKSRRALEKLKSILEARYEWKRKAREARGIKGTVLRAVVLGMPNVGKSTIINLLVGRRKARTGNVPGITRGYQWIRILGGVDLLDTRGIYEEYARVVTSKAKLALLNVTTPTPDIVEEGVGELAESFDEENWAKFCGFFRVGEDVRVARADELIESVGLASLGGRYSDRRATEVGLRILSLANSGTFGRFTLETVSKRGESLLRLLGSLRVN